MTNSIKERRMDLDPEVTKLVIGVGGAAITGILGKVMGQQRALSANEQKLWAKVESLDLAVKDCHDHREETLMALAHCQKQHDELQSELNRRSAHSQAERDDLKRRLALADSAIIELKGKLGC